MTAADDFEHDDFEGEIRSRPRVFDFFTLDGVERLTGCTLNKFLLFITKELIDNALDKKDVKNINVNICEEYKTLTLSVSDDGNPTFDRESLSKVLDFEKAPSSKRIYKTVKRGVRGNGLQSCFGISYTTWTADDRPEIQLKYWERKDF